MVGFDFDDVGLAGFIQGLELTGAPTDSGGGDFHDEGDDEDGDRGPGEVPEDEVEAFLLAAGFQEIDVADIRFVQAFLRDGEGLAALPLEDEVGFLEFALQRAGHRRHGGVGQARPRGDFGAEAGFVGVGEVRHADRDG